MNKNILLLVLAGIALSLLHAPHAMMSLVIVGGLTILTVKLFWSMMQIFSSQNGPQPRSEIKSA